MDQCSNLARHPTSHHDQPTNRLAHDLVLELEVQRHSVLTSQRLTTTLTEHSTKVVDSH